MLKKSIYLLPAVTVFCVSAAKASSPDVSHFYGGALLGAGFAGGGTHTVSVSGQNAILNAASVQSDEQKARNQIKPLLSLLLGYQGAILQTSYFWSVEAQGSFLPTSDNFVKERTLSAGSSRRTSKTTQKFSAGLAFRSGVQLSSWSPYVKLGANLGLRRFEFKSEDLSGNQLPITNTSNAFESTLSVGMGSDIPLDFCKVRVEYTCGIALTKAKKTFKDRDNDTITQSFKASPSHRLSVGAIFPL